MICTVSGTSASCPVVAGMISLVNSARLAQGNSTVGFLNPALYANYPAFTNDITSGDNKCVASDATCCSHGFYATSGWDPVTGLGSINFELFAASLLNMAQFDLSSSISQPTTAPTPTPPMNTKNWILADGYSSTDCQSDGGAEVVAQRGYPVGVCLTLFDQHLSPVSSTKYQCDSNTGMNTL